MTHRKLIAGVAGLALAVAGTSVAVAANSAAAPSKVTVKQKFSLTLKPNRYVQDGMRFDKDVYAIKSGGTVTLQLTADQEGPHTLSIVRPKDLPKIGAQVFNCKPCEKIGAAHGADPNSNAPPKFVYVENGTGQNTPANFDRPGDSAVTGQKKGDKISFKVTAKKGSTLSFMCAIHSWMQGKLKVG